MGKKPKVRFEQEYRSDEEVASSDEEEKTKPALSASAAKKALTTKLEELKSDLDWIERLDLISSTDVIVPEFSLQTEKHDENADDDFKREVGFFKQAQSAVLEAIPRLHGLNVRTKRPEDYFAQMAKSDDHMKKVRERLQSQEVIMERREKAKKLRELKKYSKQVQQQATEKRQKEKKEILEQLKKRRKLGSKNSDDIFGVTDDKGSSSKNSKNNKNSKNSRAATKKAFKDKKFGFGGKKKRSKYNTAESSADVSGYARSKKFGGNKKGKGGKALRPGKSVRQNIKARKNKNKSRRAK